MHFTVSLSLDKNKKYRSSSGIFRLDENIENNRIRTDIAVRHYRRFELGIQNIEQYSKDV